ncbi:Psi-producing oxygenase A [Hypsizygus marmoreus]|uniref:Psi-producing oxygenase A n=1 Tax=Hypsizygus marmoreus TaxID=39966 RepID=A0A369IYY2_HYPMA|nr:Psi-producing oxygenase A [Hypsizygus marmoreus]
MADISAAQAISLGADAVYLSKRPPPDAPTGYYDWQITTDPADNREGHSVVTNLVNRVQALQAKGEYKPDPRHIDAFTDAITNPTAIDDRKGAFATGLGILARLDPNSDLSKKLNNTVINTLYNTVPHPPASYLGPAHCYRHADGGGNNLDNPDIGRAGTPYSRSVQGKAGLPRSSLPDPGLIFDTILQRNGTQNHSGGMSSLIFAFASIVTHSLFRTDHKNIHINNASSYLDLSPVYGDNQAAQDKVRNKALGRGLLYPDTFSEERLLFLPPATSVLLVVFSRNHNYIAEKILKINERKLWSDPPPEDPEKRALQDEQIFQTAKLVNCGHFMSAIMGDYVAGFLGSSEGCNWNMNAFDPIQTKDLKVERGQGNHVSVEFNILYRWHAAMSEHDQKWTEGVFNSAFDGKPFDQLSLRDIATISKVFDQVAPNPAERTFAGLKRGPDGKFSDDDLANILHTATENPAGAFRGRGTPGVLRLVEIMGIEQSRAWGLCTMNEFRKFLGLKQFETFEEWNPDPEIANAARRLYGHVDNLELYTGLQAESTMPLTDGSRFACGFTTTRAVLGDAIALVRGDRFYTSDFTPINLTTWGFYDCQRNMDNGGMGGEIPKLLLRHLPRHYPWNSVYSLYPFFTPSKMKDSLTKRGLAAKYTFDHPATLRVTKVLNTFPAIKVAFSDPSQFKVIYEKYGYGSILMFDDVAQHDGDRAMVLHALFPDKDSLSQHATWFASMVKAKIDEKSWTYPNVPGKYVDIVHDVLNAVAVHVTADKLTGISLKTKDNPSGLYTERELYDMLATLFTYVSNLDLAEFPDNFDAYSVTFLTADNPETSFALHEAANQAGTIIGALAGKSILEASPSSASGFLGTLAAKATSYIWPANDKTWYPFLSRLAASGRPLDELIGNVLGVAVGASVNHAQAAINVIDFYLDDARAKEQEEIIQLVNNKDTQSAELLRGYVYEAMRLRPQFAGLYRDAAVDIQLPQGPGLPPIQIKAGDRIFGSFKNAHLNPVEFPDPTTVNPRRPITSYNLNGAGFHNCPGTAYAQQTIVEVLRVVFRLKNIRRAPGDAGRLNRFTEIVQETETDFYVQRNGTVSPWPGSMFIAYDA